VGEWWRLNRDSPIEGYSFLILPHAGPWVIPKEVQKLENSLQISVGSLQILL